MSKYSIRGYELRAPSGNVYDGGASRDDAESRRVFLRLPAETEIVDLDDEDGDLRKGEDT